MHIHKPTLACLALLACCSAHGADNCEAIGAQIDARIRAAGTTNFTLTAVDTAASAAGKVVGSCAQGTRKIVYLQAGAPRGGASAAAKPRPTTSRDSEILTECKDGSVSVGGDCKR
jgi:Protein of unknown function (DUF1161)